MHVLINEPLDGQAAPKSHHGDLLNGEATTRAHGALRSAGGRRGAIVRRQRQSRRRGVHASAIPSRCSTGASSSTCSSAGTTAAGTSRRCRVDGLARAFRVSPHHSSAILLKRNLLRRIVRADAAGCRRATFGKAGAGLSGVRRSATVERRDNVLGGPLRLDHSPAKYTRRGVEPRALFLRARRQASEIEFRPGSVVQMHAARREPGDLRRARISERAAVGAAQRGRDAVPPALLSQRQPCRLHPLRDRATFDEDDTDELRRGAEGRRRGRATSEPVRPCAERQGRTASRSCRSPRSARRTSSSASRTRRATTCWPRTACRPQLLGIVPAQGSAASASPSEAVDVFFELEIEPHAGACSRDQRPARRRGGRLRSRRARCAPAPPPKLYRPA